MKTLMIITALLLQMHSFSQKNTSYREATYKLTFSEAKAAQAKSFIESAAMENIEYIIKANDSLYLLEATTVETNEEHIHTKVSGPEKILFDINKDLVAFSNKENELYKFEPVIFTDTKVDVVIDKYKCHLIISPRNDSLFISEQLPAFVNPFILTGKSIRGGVVRAITKAGYMYSLVDIQSKEGKPFDITTFPLTANIKNWKNIFFF